MSDNAISWSGGDAAHKSALEVADEIIGTRIFDVSRLPDRGDADLVTIPKDTIFFAPVFRTHAFDRASANVPPVRDGMFLFFKPSSALMHGYLATGLYAGVEGKDRHQKVEMTGLAQIQNDSAFTLHIKKDVPHVGRVGKSEQAARPETPSRSLKTMRLVDAEEQVGQLDGPQLVRVSLSRIAPAIRALGAKMRLKPATVTSFDAATVAKHTKIAVELAAVAEKRAGLDRDADSLLSDEAELLAKRNNIVVTLHGPGDYRGRTEWQVMKAFLNNPEHVALMYLMTFSDRDGVSVFTVSDAYDVRKYRKKDIIAWVIAAAGAKETDSDKKVSRVCPVHKERRTLAIVAVYDKESPGDWATVVHATTVKPRRPESAEAVRMLILHCIQAVASPSKRLSFEMPIRFTPDDQNILVMPRARDGAWRPRSLLHEGIATGTIGSAEIAEIVAGKNSFIPRNALRTTVYTPMIKGMPKAAEVWSPLATAIASGNMSALNGLLGHDPSLATSEFAPTSKYGTPVAFAVAHDRPEMLKTLETFSKTVLDAKTTDEVRDRVYTKTVVEIAVNQDSEKVQQYFRDIKLPIYQKVLGSNQKLMRRQAFAGDIAGLKATANDFIAAGVVVPFRTTAKILLDMTHGSPPPSRFKHICDAFDALKELQLLPVCPFSLYREINEMVSDIDPLKDIKDREEFQRLSRLAELETNLQKKTEIEERVKGYMKIQRQNVEREIKAARDDAVKRMNAAMRAKSADIAAALRRFPLEDNARWVAKETVPDLIDTQFEPKSHARVVGFMWQDWIDRKSDDSRRVAEKLVEFGAPVFFRDQNLNYTLPEQYVEWALQRQAYNDGIHEYDGILLREAMLRYGVPATLVPREAVTIAANGSGSDDDDDSSFEDGDGSEGSRGEAEETSGEENEDGEMEECDKLVMLDDLFKILPVSWNGHLAVVKAKQADWPASLEKIARDSYKIGSDERSRQRRGRKRAREQLDEEPVGYLVATCLVCGEIADKRCSRCKNAMYCSADCQSEHWSKHRTTCRV